MISICFSRRIVCATALIFLVSCSSRAQSLDSGASVIEDDYAFVEAAPVRESYAAYGMKRDERLDRLMSQTVADLCDYSRKHSSSRVSATVVDLGYVDEPLVQPVFGSWRGDARVYPASVVKVFYMAAAYVWQRQGRLTITPSVYRDLKFMIGPSSNVATQDVLNLICGVRSGSALSASEFREFSRKRNVVNEWLYSLGLTNTNANQATWDDEYSPRDRQLVTGNLSGEGPHVNQNISTSNDIAKFFLLIAQNRLGSAEDCEAMRTLMARDTKDRQRSGYRRIFQDALPAGTILWGKSGFTSETSHDAGIITSPSGRRFILVVMAEVNWDNTSFLGKFAAETMKKLEDMDVRGDRLSSTISADLSDFN